MYFTDEEKEIIKKMALSDRYGLSNFFKDNNLIEKEVFLDNSYERFVYFNSNWSAQSDFGDNNTIKKESPLKKCKNNYENKLDIFIRIWIILEKINLVNSIEIDVFQTKENFIHFVKEITENKYELDTVLCRNYNYFLDKELIIYQNYLQNFINDGFKTKDEIRVEDEIKARNEALKDARKSFLVSVFLALLSVAVSVIPLFKDDNVIVKNQINTQQLESQLEKTNQELKDIKTKFEALQKQSQKPTKK